LAHLTPFAAVNWKALAISNMEHGGAAGATSCHLRSLQSLLPLTAKLIVWVTHFDIW